MDEIPKITLAVAAGIGTTAPLLASLHMLYVSHFRPGWLTRLDRKLQPPGGDALPFIKEPARWSSRFYMAYGGAAFAGLAMMAGAGCYAGLWWMPTTWGSVGEDGYITVRLWVSIATGLAGGYALINAIYYADRQRAQVRFKE